MIKDLKEYRRIYAKGYQAGKIAAAKKRGKFSIYSGGRSEVYPVTASRDISIGTLVALETNPNDGCFIDLVKHPSAFQKVLTFLRNGLSLH